MYVEFVLTDTVEAKLAVTVKSSAVELPIPTLPLAVSVPPTVKALTEKSLVPSLVPLIMSVKFWLCWSASIVVPFVNKYVTEMFAI